MSEDTDLENSNDAVYDRPTPPPPSISQPATSNTPVTESTQSDSQQAPAVTDSQLSSSQSQPTVTTDPTIVSNQVCVCVKFNA